MKVALLQLKTLPTPEENLEKIKQMLVQAKQEGRGSGSFARNVLLPL